MFIADSKIKELNSSLITPFKEDAIGPVSYDLTARQFHLLKNGEAESKVKIELLPLESVFVSTEETINLPANLLAVVNIRNSKLRQGLNLESPIYYPGHHTRVFFRLTNFSNEKIILSAGEKYAAAYFSPVDGAVDQPYQGTFQDEFDFTGMAGYTNQYKKAMHQVQDKLKDLKDLEKGIYGNVMVLMTIFVALFSLITINVNLVKEGSDGAYLIRLLVFNLGTVGSIFALIGCVQSMLKSEGINKCLVGLSVLCFLAAIYLAIRA